LVVGGTVTFTRQVSAVVHRHPDRIARAAGARPGPSAAGAGAGTARSGSGTRGADPNSPDPNSPDPLGLRTLDSPLEEPTIYEAEAVSNTFVSSTRMRRQPTASGATVVGNLGFGPAIRINGIGVAASGDYAITLYYATPTARTATIRINDHAAFPIGFAATVGPGPGTTTVGARVLTVGMRAGANTLTFGNATGRAPDLDRILVPAIPGPTWRPTTRRTIPPTTTRIPAMLVRPQRVNTAHQPAVVDTAPRSATAIASYPRKPAAGRWFRRAIQSTTRTPRATAAVARTSAQVRL
jgi:hypothetical protein